MPSFKLINTILPLLTAVGIAFAFTAPVAFAEDTGSEPVKTKATKRRGTGEDENIKSSSVENDTGAKAPAPKEKGGDATRGSCHLIVDNWTPWKVGIYVDGEYVGLLSSWGRSDGWFTSGRHNLYAVAPFSNSADLTWGPQSVNCRGSYTWQLYD